MNGNIWKYLLTAVLSITVPVGGYAFASVVSRVQKVEENQVKTATLEVEVRYLREAIQRVENKLDRELEAHHPSTHDH